MPQLVYVVTPATGVSGQIADARNYRSSTGINANGSALVVRPGYFVCRSATTAGHENECRAPAAAADVNAGGCRGFAIFRDLHVNPLVITDTDRAYYQVTETFPILEQGTMFVDCETAWTAGGKVFVRITAHGGLNVLGQVRADADTVSSVDTATAIVNGRFLDTGAAAGVARISFDLRPTA